MRWLLKLEIVSWDLTIIGSLFHSTGAAVATIHLPITFSGQTEVTDSLYYTNKADRLIY